MTNVRISAALLGATALGGMLFAATPAAAQDASQLRAIQSQIADLQAQLRKLQRQAAERDAALKKAQEDAAQARVEAQQATIARQPVVPVSPLPPAAIAAIKPNEEPVVLVHPTKKDPATGVETTDLNAPTGKFRVGGMTITLGGYVDLTGVYRSRNLTSGSGSPFNKIPFGNDPNHNIDEFRATAQQTRIAVLFEGNISSAEKLLGYVESDFNGAATTSNSVQSNSYTPRLRQAFAEYDNSALGLHVLGGQAWSLTTGFNKGITARSESIPVVLDSNYIPGFVYTRNAQVRIVKDFGPNYHLGFSLESPQSTFTVSPTTASGGVLPPVSNQKVGQTVFYSNPGGTYLNSTASYSLEAAPDLVLKAAADPGWGHYEVYGLGRFFRSQAGIASTAGIPTSNKTVFGGGVGGSFVLPVVPRYVDLSGDILAGYGVGRYGAASLPDGTFQGNGEPKPLPEVMGYVGVIGHATPRLDLFTYFGTDQIGRGVYNGTVAGKTTQVGYGATTVTTSGCYVEGGICGAQTKSLWNVSLGTWWKFLRGPWGTVQAGLQYSYTRRDAFRGSVATNVSNKPSTSDNIIFATLRYSPFN